MQLFREHSIPGRNLSFYIGLHIVNELIMAPHFVCQCQHLLALVGQLLLEVADDAEYVIAVPVGALRAAVDRGIAAGVPF